MSSLGDQLLEAHALNDKAAMIELYSIAGEQAVSDEARRFYLTHAYVFALETGHSSQADLHAKLRDLGAEE